MYDLPDPLSLMQQPAMNKSAWKILVKTRVTVYHENELRSLALANSKLEYFNVQTLGLEGRSHPVLEISETGSAPKLKAHLKFLTGDINSYLNVSNERGGSPHCRLCLAPCEDTVHIVIQCTSTAHIRERLFPELLNLVASIQPTSKLLERNLTRDKVLTQFILDPASLNLPNSHRISFQHPRLPELYSLSRDWCHAVFSHRAIV